VGVPEESVTQPMITRIPEGEDMVGTPEHICEFLNDCRFFNDCLGREEGELQYLVALFCRGAEGMECSRKQFLRATGRRPPDGMLPTGQMVSLPDDGK